MVSKKEIKMAKIKKKITWVFEYKKNKSKYTEEFNTKKEAQKTLDEWETEKKKYNLTKIFRKYFKIQYNKKDNRICRTIFLCVDCGKKYAEYEWDSGYGISERGKCLFRSNNKIKDFLGGDRCEECDKKVFKLFQDMINLYSKKTNTNTFIDIRDWKTTQNKDQKTLLHIMEIVEFWDRNKKK